jgi:hypothetical protein
VGGQDKDKLSTYLIILLIASDMCKALWFFVFPLTVLVGVLVSIHSLFCQASGFFFSQATEASDFAVPSRWRFAWVPRYLVFMAVFLWR